jgi:putative ABC transport system permease protein
LIALVIAITVVAAVIPFFNELAQTNLKLNSINTWDVGGFLLLLVIFAGVLSGIYPAAALSSFKPVEVLKENFKRA